MLVLIDYIDRFNHGAFDYSSGSSGQYLWPSFEGEDGAFLALPVSFDSILRDPALTKRTALYVRVSTDGQTVENQVRELRQVAERRGWQIVETYSDAGISGAKGRDQRPGLDQMLKDASKGKTQVVMAWAIDRLGRSLIDLLGVQHLEACGVDLFLDQQSIDTTTPTGKLMFQFTGAFAEFERSMIRQRVRARPQASRSGWRAPRSPGNQRRSAPRGRAGALQGPRHHQGGEGGRARRRHGRQDQVRVGRCLNAIDPPSYRHRAPAPRSLSRPLPQHSERASGHG